MANVQERRTPKTDRELLTLCEDKRLARADG